MIWHPLTRSAITYGPLGARGFDIPRMLKVAEYLWEKEAIGLVKDIDADPTYEPAPLYHPSVCRIRIEVTKAIWNGVVEPGLRKIVPFTTFEIESSAIAIAVPWPETNEKSREDELHDY